MGDFVERRKYVRSKTPLIFRMRKKDVDVKSWDLGAVINIGAGGVLFYHSKKYEPGTLIDIYMEMATSEPPIQSVGEIVRIESLAEEKNIFFIAVKFVNVKENGKTEPREIPVFKPENLNAKTAS